MDKVFIYEWDELTKSRRPMPIHVFEALLLAVAAGFGTSVHAFLTDDPAAPYQAVATAVIIACVFGYSVWKRKNCPEMDVTKSSLMIDGDVITLSRHVISDTGRRYFTVWDCLEVTAIRVYEEKCVIQACGRWKVSAYKVKGQEAGAYLDSEVRTIPQTLKLPPDRFGKLLSHVRSQFPDLVSGMTCEEYEEAKPFLLKHYSFEENKRTP